MVDFTNNGTMVFVFFYLVSGFYILMSIEDRSTQTTRVEKAAGIILALMPVLNNCGAFYILVMDLIYGRNHQR